MIVIEEGTPKSGRIQTSLQYEPVKVEKSVEPSPELASVISQLDSLAELPFNWNEWDAEAPNRQGIEEAKVWLRAIYQHALQANLLWHSPHVTADQGGATVLDWKKG